MKPKVLVIGGGPAGSACAIKTSKIGFETTILEKGSRYREKICGDGLAFNTKSALKELNIFDEVKTKAKCIPKATVTFASNINVTINGPFFTLQRKYLDQILRDRVKKNGGEIKYNCNIKEIKIKPDCVQATDFSGKKYTGDIAVLATGVNISLAKKLGFNFKPIKVMAIRGYAKNLKNINEYLFWINKDPSTGYGWAFPCPGGVINIGVAHYIKNKSRNNLNDALQKFINTNPLLKGSKFINPPKMWGLRTGLRKNNGFTDRILLVGENIDTTYDMSGEGVGNALKSGMLAAKTIASAKSPYDKNQLAKYQQMYLQQMLKFHKGYTKIHKLIKNRLIAMFFTKILTRSKKARKILNRIVREEKSADEFLSIRNLFK